MKPAPIPPTIAEVINDTAAFYIEDPSRRALNQHGKCVYRTEDARRRCAVGRYMTDEQVVRAQEVERSNGYSTSVYDLPGSCLPAVPIRLLADLQEWHDMPSNWLPDNGGPSPDGYRELAKIRNAYLS